VKGSSSALTCEGVTYNACGRVHSPTQRVDSDNVRCLLVPGPIFAPVAGGYFFPRVVEIDCLLEVLHVARVPGPESSRSFTCDLCDFCLVGVRNAGMDCDDKSRCW
jgi:hypothetical protein